MYRLLIVEDENIIRAGLRVMIEDLGFPFSIILEAENGLKGLDIVKEFSPEVILTDIKMPRMDGMEFIKKLRGMGSNTIIIILTGYNDFDYVKKAIQYKVIDYLLKPVKRRELKNCLIKAIKEWQEEQDKKLLLTSQSKMVNDAIHDLNEKKLKEILFGIEDNNITFSSFLKTEGIPMPLPYFFVCCGECFTADNKDSKVGDCEWEAALKYELLKQFHYCVILHGIENSVICIINSDNENNSVSLSDSLGIINCTMLHFSIIMTWGISRKSQVPDDVPRLFRQSESALSEKILYGRSRIYYADELFSRTLSLHISEKDITNIITLLEMEDYDRLRLFIDLKFRECVLEKHISVKKLAEGLYNIYFQVASYFEGFAFGRSTVVNTADDFLKAIQCCDCLSDVKKMFTETLEKVRPGSGSEDRKSNSRKSLLFAREFIQKNYFKDINLDMVANHISMTPSYFSLLFKKETGESFVDYTTNIRINKALEYLRDPQYKIYEVAVKIGFSDEKYFCKVFKKKIGVSPTEYREKACYSK